MEELAELDVVPEAEELHTPLKLLRSNAFHEEFSDGAETPASNATTLVMGETPKAG